MSAIEPAHDAPLALLGATREELCARAATLPGGRGQAEALHRSAFREGRFEPESALPAAQAAAWREALAFDLPRVVRRECESTATGLLEKAVLADARGLEYECVRIPMGRERESICLSTQVGCAMACRFCETGLLGRLRQLSAAEIVGQVVLARAQLGWRPTQVVFMGMGEPLDNTANLIQALHVLTDRAGLGFARERLTVCTIGRREGLAALHALGWKRLNLAISLNAADDARRSELMPATRALPLQELQELLISYRPRANFRLGLHWCLLPGLNDTRDDARRLAAWCAPLGRVLVQVIPYNPGTQPITRAPSEDEIARFLGWLREEGLAVRRRITKGRGVMAACGQLGNAELRGRAPRERGR
ncbi:MAG: radical SAM protein [Planctomycetes bacterium]|nr:radical SAM protein [Planctomycetota bacterium]